MNKAFLLLLSLLILIPVVIAPCPAGFSNSQVHIHPDDNTHGLLIYEDQMQTLVLEPKFHGDATNFGLVLPTPSRPEVNEESPELFEELDKLTKPIRSPMKGFGRIVSFSSANFEGVNVIEQKDVGDFEVTVLTADDEDSLTNWLTQNNYSFNDIDKSNFKYYTDQEGYHFVAMKVKMTEADCLSPFEYEFQRAQATRFTNRFNPTNLNNLSKEVDPNNCLINGKLNPISFKYQADEPSLPLRSMAGDMPVMEFVLYTISDNALIVPGANLQFSKRLGIYDTARVSELDKFSHIGKHLTKSSIKYDPKEVIQDLTLQHVTLEKTDFAQINSDQAIEGIILPPNPPREKISATLQPQLPKPVFLAVNLISVPTKFAFMIFSSIMTIFLELFTHLEFILFLLPILFFAVFFTRRLYALSTMISSIIISLCLIIMIMLDGYFGLEILLMILIPTSFIGLFAFLFSWALSYIPKVKHIQSSFSKVGLLQTTVYFTILASVNFIPLFLSQVSRTLRNFNLFFPIYIVAYIALIIYSLYKIKDMQPKYIEVKNKKDYLIPIICFIVFSLLIVLLA